MNSLKVGSDSQSSGGGMAMKFTFPGVLVAAIALLGPAIPAFAHHGFSVEFDGSKCMNLKGTLTSIDWENPHAYLHMDVKGADGKTVSWRLELITPNALKRNGTTRQDFTENVGKPMAARACPTKEGGTPNRGAAEFIELADNQVRVTGQLVEKVSPDQFHF
jgi:hypothetical protein